MVVLENEIGHANTGIVPWSSFYDVDEIVPELAWPDSVRVYGAMRNDAQIDALYLAVILPILGYRWFLDPNGARDEVVEHFANDLNVGIEGEDPGPQPRRRDRFDLGEHLRMALLKLIYGHMFFEQVYRLDGDRLHIRKLAPRMPGSISEIQTARDGGLEYIRQYPAGSSGFNLPTRGLSPLYLESPKVPVDRLVAHINDKEGGNWHGRSLLRSLYKHWLRKDRLLRVDAVRHERNGAGIPIITAPPGASRAQMVELNLLAQKYKVGEAAGGALPNGAKLELVGVSGSVSDILASLRYDDETMAARFLAMFMQLGKTETGSRALGATFVDFFQLAQESVAKTIAATTNEHVIEDAVDLNWGENEAAPLLKFEKDADKKASIADLKMLIDSGALVVDDDLEAFVRAEYNLPEIAEGRVVPAEPKLKVVAASGRKVNAALTVGGRTLRRNPWPEEVAAAVDYEAMETAWSTQRLSLVETWKTEVKNAQVEALTEAILAAETLADLADIDAPVMGENLLVEAMTAMAAVAAVHAIGEAAAQGVSIDPPDADELARDFEIRAVAQATIMSRSIAQTAAAKAIGQAGSGLAMDEVATAVREHLDGLSDSYLEDELGGTMTQAQNTARREVFGRGPAATYYASELLDSVTCKNCKPPHDGKTYASLDEATEDYPSGGYKNCLGGSRCRGTIVAVYDETGPSVP